MKRRISNSRGMVLFVLSIVVVSGLGRSFLPEFNEGALTVSYVTAPDTSLDESDKIGREAELRLPFVGRQSSADPTRSGRLFADTSTRLQPEP